MLPFLCVAVFFVIASAQSCPPQYQLMEGICIRVLVPNTGEIHFEDKLPSYREECNKDNAHLPIIKSDEENAKFNNIMNTLIDEIGSDHSLILLDLICNSTEQRLYWVDGTPASYSRKGTVNFNFNCVSTGYTVVSFPYYDEWEVIPPASNAFYTVLCVFDGTTSPTPATTAKPTEKPTVQQTVKPTETPIDAQCGDYELMTNPTDGSKPCIKVFTDSLSWKQAQNKCASDFASIVTINSAEENKYFWRTAIGNKILEGMHIGAHQSSTEDPSKWTWSDGEIPFDGKTYDNFASFFPIPGAGGCSSMVTENTAAFWINEDCDENVQPFICRRAVFSIIPANCPSVAPKAGEDFYPPGFPNPDIACEYFLVVGANKLVELQVLTLVSEDNKDFLEILEGTSGPHLLANLTGTILTPTKFTTVKSNVMRVNWKPNGSGSGRGFRIRYNEVNP